MKWENRGKSRNVVDRRGSGGGGRSSAGIPLGFGGLAVLVVVGLILGINPLQLIGVINGTGTVQAPQSAPSTPAQTAGDEEMVGFVSAVLDDSQTMWASIFQENNIAYEEAQLSLEDGNVASACGTVPAAAGPFYCPLDQIVYLNFAFYDELQSRYGASGDFAEAYVIAHEIGHHVQHLLGTADDVRQRQQQNPARANQLSVALELQADCYAGVWGGEQTQANQASTRVSTITRADFQEGITAAAAIGDDAIQERTTGRVNPEAFTHGSSEQRVNWFTRGFESRDPGQCDTFAASG